LFHTMFTATFQPTTPEERLIWYPYEKETVEQFDKRVVESGTREITEKGYPRLAHWKRAIEGTCYINRGGMMCKFDVTFSSSQSLKHQQ